MKNPWQVYTPLRKLKPFARRRKNRFYPKLQKALDTFTVVSFANREETYRKRFILIASKFSLLTFTSKRRSFQTYVTDIFLAQSWRDPRLRLPENMSEDYRILDVEWLHSIWRPDCFFKNAKSVTFHEMTIPNHYLWLYHDKTLLYMSKYRKMLSM